MLKRTFILSLILTLLRLAYPHQLNATNTTTLYRKINIYTTICHHVRVFGYSR